jgi:Fic family protein
MYVPDFTITNQILKNIGTIEGCREVIEAAPLIPLYEKQFKSDAIVRTIHHGTHIEGNDLTLSQTRQVLEGEEVVARERDIQEIINYRRVMDLIDELASKRGEYDLSMLFDIHKETVNRIVSEEKSGVLRKTRVIIKEEGTGKIIFQPPPAEDVPALLDKFFKWLNLPQTEDIHSILKAGITHYVLVSIHPFVEGNGRTTRAFSNLILLREGYDIKHFFSLEENFDADPGSYYEAFSKVDKQSESLEDRDLTSWLEYFTSVVAIELTKIKERVRKLSIDNRLKDIIGMQVALTERQMMLIEYLSEHGSAVMQDLKDVLPMVSEDTVLRDINALIGKKILKKQGSTKAARYVLASH